MIKNLFYIAILTSVVIFSWISFGIYHNYTTSTISTDTNILITPIAPRFDDVTVRNVTNRKVIEADLSEKKSSATPTLVPQISIQQKAATPGAGL